MARPLRIQYEGAWYHVMNRGAGRKLIFRNRKHRLQFLEVLADIVETYKIEIHAFCLMGNHYHLLVRTPLGNLSEAMKHLGSVYTIKYNKSLNIDGPLFRGRYKAKIIQESHYALHLVKYIHLNPLKAGLVTNLEKYEWSSYNACIGLTETPPWLTVEYTKAHFNDEDFVDEFREYMHEDSQEDIEQHFSPENKSPIIGTEEFFKKIKSNVNYQSLCSEITDRKNLRPSLNEIIITVAAVFNQPIPTVQKYKRDCNDARDCAMLIAKKHYGYRLKEISDQVDIKCYQTVSSACFRFESKINQKQTLLDNYTVVLRLLNRSAKKPNE